MDTRREFIVGCAIAVAVMLFSLVGFAEDPIVVHYSDPSLARMEGQIGVTAVHIVFAPQTVISDGQQGINIGWQIDPRNCRALVSNYIQKPWILAIKSGLSNTVP